MTILRLDSRVRRKMMSRELTWRGWLCICVWSLAHKFSQDCGLHRESFEEVGGMEKFV